MIGTSYVPFFPWACLWGWIPLWLQVDREQGSLKKVFWAGWISQFVLTLIGFHWVSHVVHEFGSMPWAVSILLLLVFASLVHLYIPFSLVIAKALQRKWGLSSLSFYLLCAGLLTLGEIYWPSLFQWHMGYTLLWINSPVAQVSEWVGFQGLSFILSLANAVLAWAWQHRQQQRTHSMISLTLVAGVFMGLQLLGLQLQKKWQNPDSSINILAVQGNIGNSEKFAAQWGRNFQQEIINKYILLSEQGLRAAAEQQKPAQLVVWPESAFPAYLDAPELGSNHAQALLQFTQQNRVALMTGAYSHELKIRRGHVQNIDYNAVFLLSEQGGLIDVPHRKTHLLAFGEYMPFEDEFPFLSKINPNGGSFGAGLGPQIFRWSPYDKQTPTNKDILRLGSQICYESLYPDFSRNLSLLGAHILFNGTNDAWYGPYSEPDQHMIMTLARALEIRRPLMRSTNTGMTTAILADGTRLGTLARDQEVSGIFTIPFYKNPEQTLFTQFGRWLPLVVFLTTGILVAFVQLFVRNQRTP